MDLFINILIIVTVVAAILFIYGLVSMGFFLMKMFAAFITRKGGGKNGKM